MDRSRQITARGSNLSLITLIGSEISSIFDELAALRMHVFREFPYLYEGSVDYEKKYLGRYSRSPRGFLVGLFDQKRLIGAATALPLEDEEEFVQNPFQNKKYPVSSIFYFGESVLLPDYRGQGLGHILFDEREKFALSDPQFSRTSFCTVVRPSDHPSKPTGYKPLNDFWLKRGYILRPEIRTEFSWADVGEKTESLKPMQYWMKEWRS